MKTKVTKSYILINIALLFVISLFIFLVSYIRPPICDDVLSQFKNGISCYLDEKESRIGNQVSNIYDRFNMQNYNNIDFEYAFESYIKYYKTRGTPK